MTFEKLLRELQGNRSQEDFAREVGLGQATISLLLSGERRPGATVIRKLCRIYPKERGRIMDVFLSPDNHYQDLPITNVNEATS